MCDQVQGWRTDSGDQRGGQWMGADKNSSLWLNSAYTPIATPRTHTHKQDPKQESNNLKGTTKKPRDKKRKQTNKNRSTSSELQKPGRTVRVAPADYPRRGRGPSGHHTRTVRKSTPNQQSRTLKNRTVHDWAACWRKICTSRQTHNKPNKLASHAKRSQDVPVNFPWKLTKEKVVKFQSLELAGWYQTVPYLRLKSQVRWHIAIKSYLPAN
jgi:hypothetical protein